MIKSHIPVGVLLMASGLSLAADELSFSAETMMAWPTRSFEGETAYRLVERDGTRVLQASARQQASAKYLEKMVDLDRTPNLHWCWQVSAVRHGLAATTRGGDDYPARVYVARKTGILPWQVQSVNYVWASSQPAGSHWPNAFTSRAQLLALQGGASPSSPGIECSATAASYSVSSTARLAMASNTASSSRPISVSPSPPSST